MSAHPSRWTLCLATLALVVVLAPPAAAQRVHVVSVDQVTHLGPYDLATQTFGAPGGADGSVIVYDNTVYLGEAVLAFSPADLIFMDWGTLSALGHNQITDIQVGYIASVAGPVDLRVRIHAGATGMGNMGTVVVDVDVTGLPGSTGGPQAFMLDIDLEAAGVDAFVPDGPVGYSVIPMQQGTGPLLAGPPNAPGVVDLLDLYSGTGAYLTSIDLEANASLYFQMTGQHPPECHLVLGQGFGPGSAAFTGSGHEFVTQVGAVIDSWPVLLDDIPEFVIWDPPAPLRAATFGLSGPTPVSLAPAEPWLFSAQVVMWNPAVFPANPEQFTHGLAVAVLPDGGVYSQPYGVSDGGLAIWAETDWNAAGQKVLRLPFSIPGF